MDAEAFDELGGVISDNDGNDGSDLEVDINPEGEPRVDNEGEQQKGQEQREEQEDDVAALSVAELEVRIGGGAARKPCWGMAGTWDKLGPSVWPHHPPAGNTAQQQCSGRAVANCRRGS